MLTRRQKEQNTPRCHAARISTIDHRPHVNQLIPIEIDRLRRINRQLSTRKPLCIEYHPRWITNSPMVTA